MENWKDQLQQSQKQGGGDYPKLSPDYRITLTNKEGVALFKFYDASKEKEKRVSEVKGTITGVLIGSAMKISAFDQNHGNNGGSYNSTYFIAKSNRIVLFSPAGNKTIGNCDELKAAITQESSANPSLKRALFIATKGGLLVIETNLTMDIEQFKSFDKDVFLLKMIKVSPKLYDKDDSSFSDRAHKNMKIASAPPAYTNIEVGSEITDEIAIEYEIMKHSKAYNEWKEYLMGGNESQDEIVAKNEVETQKAVDNFQNPSTGGTTVFTEEPDDDLPF
jgi:hypothetical protein